jgi:predicted phage-related endonuclease
LPLNIGQKQINIQEEQMTDRFGIIGASEIAGLLKEYKDNLLEEGFIDNDIHNKLRKMPSYLETRYSLARKLMLDREQFKRFNEYNSNKAMQRGKECEAMVKDNFIYQHLGLSIAEEQVIKEKLIKNCNFPFRATIDYLLSSGSLLECKTTDITQWFKIENDGCPFNYEIQANAQMWLHGKEKCYIHIAGVQTTNGDHKILESKTFTIYYDKQIINAIQASLIWFSAEFEKGTLLIKDEADKVKKDKQIDDFLEIEKGTLEQSLTGDLSAKLRKLKRLKKLAEKHDKLDKEIKAEIRKLMGGYSMARFKSNQFEIEAKFSKESYHDEASINETIEKAKSINIGDVKSAKRLTIKY